MRHWLLTQAMVFFPLLTFCLMLAALFWTLPDENGEALPLLETTATGIFLAQERADGGMVNMEAAQLTRAPDGGIRIAGLRLRIALRSGVLTLRNEEATLDEEANELSLPSAVGEFSSAGRRATLSLTGVSYRLEDGRLTGGAVSVAEANKTFAGKSFIFSNDGRLVMQGDIRASFPVSGE